MSELSLALAILSALRHRLGYLAVHSHPKTALHDLNRASDHLRQAEAILHDLDHVNRISEVPLAVRFSQY